MSSLASALILGISGQDGSYLSQHLLSKGYSVTGTTRSTSHTQPHNHSLLGLPDLSIVPGFDPCSFTSVSELINTLQPDHIYVLSGPSSVGDSFVHPFHSLYCIPTTILNILESVKRYHPRARVYNACSSDCFSESIRFSGSRSTDELRPVSPYGTAKSQAHQTLKLYRENFGLFACSAFLFNHESPLRPPQFVSRKIISTLCRIYYGSDEKLHLGRTDISRDWGYAPEYVQSMNLMLERDSPDDFVIATGARHTLLEFVEQSCSLLGLNQEDVLITNNSLRRPTDIVSSFGDPSVASEHLGWKSNTDFKSLINLLIQAELKSISCLHDNPIICG